MKQTIAALCWLLLSVSVALAQGPVLRLTSESNDLPVAEARVMLLPAGRSFVPDAQGRVQLPTLSAGDRVVITHPEGQTLSFTAAELAARDYAVLLVTRAWLFDDVVISANRAPEAPLLVPQVVDVVNRSELTRRQPQTTPDALEQQGVFVQRSQLGGGSPVIRGFEASRVLLVIDGIRMNNAVYRAGHLQNLVTLDPAQLERVEVVAGPGSSLYGSDALGGTVHLTTRGAELSDSGRVSGEAYFRSASAASATAGHLSVNLGRRRWASRTSLTLTDLGDLRAGHIRLPIWGRTGSRDFTQAIDPATGADLRAINPDRNRQTRSGYQQIDLLQKVLFQPKAGTRWGLNLQLSNSSNIERYDRLSETTGSGAPRFAEWYYGPQFRVLVAPSLELDRSSGAFDHLRVTLAYQRTHEDRLQRRWLNPSLQAQRERISNWSLNADLSKRLGAHELSYGLEASYQTVDSRATLFNRSTATVTERPDLTRYPAGGSTYTAAAVYVSDRFELARSLWANVGARYQYVGVEMNFIPENNLPFDTRARNHNHALVGNASLVWLPAPSLRWSVLGSTGFRAPNVDDLGKFFEAPPGVSANVLIVPNPSLRPERTTNLESTLSLSPRIEGGSLTLAATGWYTWFDQALLLSPTRALGADSVTYNGSRVATFSIQNASRAELWGLTGRLTASFGPWSLRANVNYTRGRVIEPTPEPLDHVAPVHGSFSLRYTAPRWNLELANLWNGWKWAADYRPFGEDNPQYATPNGMPAWMIWTLRAEAILSDHVSVQAALENLQDLHYRTFASGISGPGRNLMLTLRYRW